MVRAAGGGAIRPRRAHPQVHRDAVQPQRRRLLARQLPRARRHDRDHPGLRGATRSASRCSATRSRRSTSLHPLTGEVVAEARRRADLPGLALRRRAPSAMQRGDRHDRGRARRAAQGARVAGQAARGAAPAHAHHVRPRDDAADRVLLGHRELLAAHRRPRAGRGAALPARLLPRRLPRRDRRVARHGAADRRDVRGRRLAQAHPRRARVPAAERARQPPAALGRVQEPRRPDGVPVGDAGALRDGHRRRRRRADHPPDRPRRPADRREALEGPDRRPARRDPRARRARRARARHDAHQEDGRGAHRLPRRAGVRVRYLHSDVDTLRRVELLTELRAGVYDVLVGINLLREGLDLPEVSLVAILDADKEGFLRSATSLIQTIGRAARNVSGEVHMYADSAHRLDEGGDRRDRPAPREAGRVQPRRTASTRSRCASASPTSPRCSLARAPTPPR